MRTLTCSRIYQLCVDYFGFELDKHSRKRYYVYPREVYYRLCKDFARDWSLSTCGSIVGRDHATVLYGVRAFERDRGQKYFVEYFMAYKLIAARIGHYHGPTFHSRITCNPKAFKICISTPQEKAETS